MERTVNREAVLIGERVLAAPPRSVFDAFRQPELLARWWGPKGFTNTFHVFEFRPGGRWDFTMHGPNGTDYTNENIFREIQPDSRIVIEHVLHPPFRLAVTLTARGERTHLLWEQEFESAEMAGKFRTLSLTANEENLDRLEAVLADVQRTVKPT